MNGCVALRGPTRHSNKAKILLVNRVGAIELRRTCNKVRLACHVIQVRLTLVSTAVTSNAHTKLPFFFHGFPPVGPRGNGDIERKSWPRSHQRPPATHCGSRGKRKRNDDAPSGRANVDLGLQTGRQPRLAQSRTLAHGQCEGNHCVEDPEGAPMFSCPRGWFEGGRWCQVYC